MCGTMVILRGLGYLRFYDLCQTGIALHRGPLVKAYRIAIVPTDAIATGVMPAGRQVLDLHARTQHRATSICESETKGATEVGLKGRFRRWLIQIRVSGQAIQKQTGGQKQRWQSQDEKPLDVNLYLELRF